MTPTKKSVIFGMVPRPSNGKFSLKNYNNFTVRTILTIFLIGTFLCIILAGQFYCAVLVVSAAIKIYYEIVSLHDKAMSFAVTSDDEGASTTPARRPSQMSASSAFRPSRRRMDFRRTVYFFSKAPDLLSWISLETYFLLVALVLVAVPWLVPRLQHYNNWLSRALLRLMSYHYLIAFLMTMGGMIKFVITMERGRYKQQFLKLALIVISVLYVVFLGLMIVSNIYYGMVWFLCPHIMVILNDLMAYLFGKYVGKRPLIMISPKKTVEGFIYAALVTVLSTGVLVPVFLSNRAFLCPTNHFSLRPLTWLYNKNCKLGPIYEYKRFPLPGLVHKLLGVKHVVYSDFIIHMLVLSVFASLFAPFGGFLASGFKRALKIKDFSDFIPGHGGFTDRFDCQIVMGGFTYFYLKTFVRKQQLVEVVYKMYLKLPKNEQLDLLSKFRQLTS